jgi:hypothetical protein
MSSLYTLLSGLVIGYLAQRSRFCLYAPIRDTLLMREWHGWRGVLVVLVVSFFLYSLANRLGWLPLDTLGWSSNLTVFLVASALAGLGLGLVSAWANGCPTRQHVAAGQGDHSARLYLLGFYLGIPLFYLIVSPLLETILW